MQRTVASFALATLSLLTSYVIAATWPDVVPRRDPLIASAPAVQPQVASAVIVGLAN